MEDDGGKPVTYTILGAWDSVPEKNIVSYLSEIGMTLIGTKPGDRMEVRDMDTETNRFLTVKKIEAYK